MPFATINAVLTHYEIHGRGPACLLIHDLGSSLADWEQQVPVLARHNKVVTVSLRGFGQSQRIPGPVSIEGYAADVAGLLNHLDLSSVRVLGHGLGGAVAFQLAVDHPRRVSGLAVLNGQSCCELEDWRRHLMVLSRLGTGSTGMERISRYVARQLFPLPQQVGLRQRLRERQSANTRGCYLAALRALAGWSVADRLHSIEAPVLMIRADNDYDATADRRVRGVPNVRFEVIANSRHGTPWDQPAALNRLFLTFLEDTGEPVGTGDPDQAPAPVAGDRAASVDVPAN